MTRRNLALMIGTNSKAFEGSREVALFLRGRLLGKASATPANPSDPSDVIYELRWTPAVKYRGLPLAAEDAARLVRLEGGSWKAA